ncbi:MAG: hypothetical protein A2Z75_04905 [Chloroflexi bacterium RBG_13_50_10]|nr:MAG: hypothetical protein A2Z75_04905 [Chloroflexi bacterium RBG_13_50_10]
MPNWAELGTELENTLRLKTKIIAYRRLEKTEELDSIKNVIRLDRFFTFCQVPFMVRVNGITVGITKEDKILERCSRLFGLRQATEKSMNAEAAMLSTTWFRSPEDALQQQADYYRIPVGGAIVLAPLTRQKFEPEVLLVYGNPAQIMMVLCGLQKVKYERFSFSFIGEGACSDSLAQCYITGKPSVSIPCSGERSMGGVSDDEIVVALPPGELERAISGLKELAKIGRKYPIDSIGPWLDPTPLLSGIYRAASQR